MAWLYVPASAVSNSASESPSETPTVLSVTLSGKPSPRPVSWRGWKKRPWIARLSGTISRPSMAGRGVDSWMSSLRATRASRSASPESVAAQAIRDICGPMWPESLESANLDLFSSKTSPDTLISVLARSRHGWRMLVSALNRDYLARLRSARHTNGNGCSSWPTARAEERCQKNSADAGMALSRKARNWPSPRAEDSESRGNHPGAMDSLTGVVSLWHTPKTPTGGAESKRSRAKRGAEGQDLESDALQFTSLFPTPASRDAKGANSKRHCTETGTGRKHMGQLPNFLAHSPQGRTISTLGRASSAPGQTSRLRLNPAFDCWLMGYPAWWTSTGPTASGRAEMESYLSVQRRLLSRLLES